MLYLDQYIIRHNNLVHEKGTRKLIIRNLVLTVKDSGLPNTCHTAHSH